MLKSRAGTRKGIVYLVPFSTTTNKYAELFAKSILDEGFDVRQTRWNSLRMVRADFVIFHWPRRFFERTGLAGRIRAVAILAIIRLLKRIAGTRFIWVAHNIAPHDSKKANTWLTKSFIRSLDGIIFLSAHSRVLIGSLYPDSRKLNALVTVHGHYRDIVATPPTPNRAPGADVNLVHLGLVRPYKNIEALIDASMQIKSGLQLLVMGMIMDRKFAESLLQKLQGPSHVRLDLRDDFICDAEFEAAIDSGDAVVLPYRDILNSGSALFSLSRNRPVLAPKIGSLTELRDAVGSEWLYLYEGDFSAEVLTDFLTWLRRTKRNGEAPLHSYDWSRVGRDVGGFLVEIAKKKDEFVAYG